MSRVDEQKRNTFLWILKPKFLQTLVGLLGLCSSGDEVFFSFLERLRGWSMRPQRECRVYEKWNSLLFFLSYQYSHHKCFSFFSTPHSNSYLFVHPMLLPLMMIQVDFHEDGLSHQTFLSSLHFDISAFSFFLCLFAIFPVYVSDESDGNFSIMSEEKEKYFIIWVSMRMFGCWPSGWTFLLTELVHFWAFLSVTWLWY